MTDVTRRITPQILTAERAKVGIPLGRMRPHVEMATKDAIRHWAHGIGDRNPLWTDEAYAAASVWGGMVAPPTIVLAMDRNIVRARGFRGVHGWHLGTRFEWTGPIRLDLTVSGSSTIESLTEVQSAYAGGSAYDQVIRTDVRDASDGGVVCVARSQIRRFEREAGRDAAKYKRSAHTYTDAELSAIARAYDREKEQLRGSTPRYVGDVEIGEVLPEIVRGPLTIMDCIAFVIAWGGAYIYAHGFAWDFLREHPGVFPRNSSNVPDSPERTHWSDAFAQEIGAPAAFDYGPQRIAWCGTLLTNWMGDAGWLRALSVRLLRPNYHGDTLRIGGQVSAVDVAASAVSVSFAGHNQVDEAVVDGTAEVILPRRAV